MANLYDPSAEQPTYKKSLLAALGMPDDAGSASPAVMPPRIENTGVSGGPDVTGAPSPAPAAAPTWSPGAKAGQHVTLLGYDSGKLDNTGYSTGKYNPEVRAFYGGLNQDVGLSRGGLDNMIHYLQSNGYANAKAVGDDKIDFGNGTGPIDVIRSDGQIVFQDPRGAAPGASGSGGPAPVGAPSGISPVAALLQGGAGGNIQNALSAFPQVNDNSFLQQLIAQLQGGR